MKVGIQIPDEAYPSCCYAYSLLGERENMYYKICYNAGQSMCPIFE